MREMREVREMRREDSRNLQRRPLIRRAIQWLLLVLLLSSCADSPRNLQLFDAPAPSESDRIAEEPLRVRGDWSYPPFEYINDAGEPAGFNIDIIRRVAEIMSIPLEIELGPWAEVRRQLEEGEIDILAGMYRSPERDKKVDFTIPHFIASYGIFVPRGSSIRSAEDLEQARVVVQEADLGHDYLLSEDIGADLVTVREWKQVLPALAQGRADAAVMGMAQGVLAMQKGDYDSLRIVGEPLLQRSYSIAVGEGRDQLLAALNEGLNILKISGEYDEIYERWFGLMEAYSARGERRMRVALIIVAVLAGVIIIGFLWTLFLRKEVRRKTAALSEELARREEMQRQLESVLEEVDGARREAEAARAEAERANEAKSQFLGGVSHELRTPLHGIMGVERLLSRSPLDGDQRRLLGELRTMSEHLLRIISDLIDITRVSSGTLSLHPTAFYPADLAEWSGPALRSQAKEKGVEFLFDLRGSGSKRLYGDKARVVQIIVNLGTNAVKFTPRGGKVRVLAEWSAAGLTLRVEDSGSGIPEEVREQIFEPFFQQRSEISGARRGLGLGLSIVSTLTKLMGGRVNVADREGGGSVFTVELPLSAAEEGMEAGIEVQPAPAPEQPAEALMETAEEGEAGDRAGESTGDHPRDDRAEVPIGTSLAPETPSGEGRTIVVVEDEAINRLYLVRILEERGWRVLQTGTGEEAVKLAAESECSLVLMDLSLQGSGGLEAAQGIRAAEAAEERRSVPIIALTAHAAVEYRERCKSAGMEGFLSKPFQEHQLWTEIERVLE